MKMNFKSVIGSLVVFFPTACSDGSFKSEHTQPAISIAPKAADSRSAPAQQTQQTQSPVPVPVSSQAPATVDNFLDVCLKEFNAPNVLTDKVIAETKYETVSLPNANNSVIYVDKNATAGPVIIRITIDSRNANKGILELKNPNGFYCVNYLGAVVNNFTIAAECNTKFVILDLNYKRSNSFNTQQVCQ